MQLFEYFWDGLQVMLLVAGVIVVGVAVYIVFLRLDDAVLGRNRSDSPLEPDSVGSDDDDGDWD